MNVTISSPTGEESSYSFDTDTIVIGRGQNCDVVIADDHVSRKHLEIKKFDGLIFLKDLTLSNWISYNEEKLEKGVDVQYFDFAPLILPGNYRVKISDEEVFEEVDESFTKSTGIDIFNSELASYDVDEDEEEESSKKGKKSKSKTSKGKKWKPTRQLKKRNDPAIMSVVGFIVLTLVVYQFFFKDKDGGSSDLDKLQNIKKANPYEKRVINRKAKPRPKPQVKAVTNLQQVKKSNAEAKDKPKSVYEEVLFMQQKCQSPQMKAICSSIFPQLSNLEGIQRIEKTMYIVKNYTVRGTQLLRSRDNFKNTIIKSDKLEKIIAGEAIMMPNFLKMLELNGVNKVVVILFDMNRLQVQLKSKFEITVSDYRKFDLGKYTKAYSSVVAKQDSSLFEFNLMNYIKEI